MWVKLGNTQCEQMFSAVHPTTDIAQKGRHVRSVPQRGVLLAPHPERYARLSDHRETETFIEPSSRIVLEDFKHNLLPR